MFALIWILLGLLTFALVIHEKGELVLSDIPYLFTSLLLGPVTLVYVVWVLIEEKFDGDLVLWKKKS